jgi:HprK-related kinase A
MLEWGMNWAVAAHELQYVIVHSAVLAKNGKAIIFPAPPGSGKSTLTAHLANNGWRLLSDEMALISLGTKTVHPFVRPICLKNQSIALAQSWFPESTFSTIATHTHKGDVIHMAPPKSSSEAKSETAEIVGIVFPQYQADTTLDIYHLDMNSTFLRLIDNAFNLKAIGDEGFKTAVDLIETCARFEINYNDLNEVESFLSEEIIDAN